MADYGLNFGFRRSGGDSTVREGRYRVPATGTFRQGNLVTIDGAAPGYIKLAPAAAGFVPGITGLLIQEFELDSIYSVGDLDSHTRGVVKNGYLCTIWSGQGEKIWIRNTPAETRWDGRAIAAVSPGTFTAIAVLDLLEWNGTVWVERTAGTPALQVTAVTGTTYVEAVTLA